MKMKKLLALFLIFLFFFVALGSSKVFAQNATCDLCGYCPPAPAPSSWASCRSCIYPSASSNPATGGTLKISNNVAPTPAPGSYYTMLGCFKTNLTDFTQQGAAGSVVQTLLNTIFSIAGGVAFLYILFGAYQITTSQNNPERLNYGRRMIVGSIIGLIISLSSIFLVNLIANNILKIPGFTQ